ncbi:MAG: YbaK/EbsC family protein [Chloroflexota bacterium]
MRDQLHPSAKKVQEAVEAKGFNFKIFEFSETTRTSEDAAKAAGCELGQIAKSLVFRGKKSNQPVMVIASGVNRVDEKAIKAVLGEKIGRADADYVREHTGFAIGGVPAVAHVKPIRIFIDEDLMKWDEIWSAAGTPHAIYPLTPAQLVEMTNAEVIRTKKVAAD